MSSLKDVMKMTTVFFVTSAGDTDLAIATADRLFTEQNQQKICFAPLSKLAADRISKHTFSMNNKAELDVFPQLDLIVDNKLHEEGVTNISAYLKRNAVTSAYFGVPSSNNPNETLAAFELAEQLDENLNKIIAFEYLYKEENHPIWDKLPKLAALKKTTISVPTYDALDDVLPNGISGKFEVVGHLCFDKAKQQLSTTATDDTNKTREQLNLKESDKLAVISGTSIGQSADLPFVKAILEELKTGRYNNLQLRFAIHPGVKEPIKYFSELLNLCEEYPKCAKQFKIILTPEFLAQKLENHQFDAKYEKFVQRCSVSGPAASNAAKAVAQAVPGALVNESAVLGKDAYCFQPVKSYLPSNMMSKDLKSFLAGGSDVRLEKNLQIDQKDASSVLAKKLVARMK